MDQGRKLDSLGYFDGNFWLEELQLLQMMLLFCSIFWSYVNWEKCDLYKLSLLVFLMVVLM